MFLFLFVYIQLAKRNLQKCNLILNHRRKVYHIQQNRGMLGRGEGGGGRREDRVYTPTTKRPDQEKNSSKMKVQKSIDALYKFVTTEWVTLTLSTIFPKSAPHKHIWECPCHRTIVTLYHKPLVKSAKMILRYMPKCDGKVHWNVHILENSNNHNFTHHVLWSQ